MREIPVFNPRPNESTRFSPRAYLGNRWAAMRRTWLMQHPTCERCGLAGEEVHHKTPRALAPEKRFEWTNLATLCRRCHVLEHGRSPRDGGG